MIRIGLFMVLFIVAGCASPETTGRIADRSEMIFVPPVEVYETTECIQLRKVRSTRVIDRVGIAYEMPDRKVWLNRPEWGASMLDDDLVMVTSTNGNMLCSGDIVRFLDSSPVGFRSAIALGPFISYTRNE
ncbi:MAG: hypothetical protein Pars92KO_27220 [Parasphingorhabdus sp.]